MKQYIAGGLAAALIAGWLIGSAPPASAGCQYGAGLVVSKCDGPVQPDGTWQRCVVFNEAYSGSGLPYGTVTHHCDAMGPDLHPWGLAFNDTMSPGGPPPGDPILGTPPTHIDP